MSDQPSLLIGGASGKQVRMIASMANRHGMIAGAKHGQPDWPPDHAGDPGLFIWR